MNTRVGCKRDARKAIRGQLKELGSGISRTGYLDPKGQVVYKVQRHPLDDANRREVAYCDMLREAGVPATPPMTLWVIKESDGSRHEVVALPKVTLIGELRDAVTENLTRPDDRLPDDEWREAWRVYEAERKLREEPLRETLDKVQLVIEEATEVAYQAGYMLDDLHQYNHGVADDGSVYITDLGHCR